MNLLQLLLGSLLSTSSVNSVSQKTGLSSKLVQKLITAALPLLIKYLTQNVLAKGGAASLLGALTQHTSNRTIAEQIDDADVEDGAKIIRHILGNDQEKVVAELAEETGIQGETVTRGLASIAPALLSTLSAAASQQAKPQAQAAAAPAADLTSLFNMFAGQSVQQAQQQSQANNAVGLLNSLLGTGTQQTQASNATATSVGSLLSLLGGAAAQQAQPQQNAAVDGTQLLNVLASLMK
ncbi:MAG: DUF937 domain-containing protein [Solobacterium sp.]|nr:DUF937 domain-containing protein [Erysipelotrichaceae bacterium]MBQ9154960.1 DUF937 domain-containing protein [Solobacterium sp.]